MESSTHYPFFTNNSWVKDYLSLKLPPELQQIHIHPYMHAYTNNEKCSDSSNKPILANSLNQKLLLFSFNICLLFVLKIKNSEQHSIMIISFRKRIKMWGDITSILWVDHSHWNYVSCDYWKQNRDSACRWQMGHMHLLLPSTYFQFNSFELSERIFILNI